MERSGNPAQADELGKDPGQVGPRSAGQSAGSQRLSPIADAAEESTEELSETNQSRESAAVEGSEDAATIRSGQRIPVRNTAAPTMCHR